MVKTDQHESTDESDDNDTYAVNALKDFDNIPSDVELDIEKLNLSSNQSKNTKDKLTEIKDKSVSESQISRKPKSTTENHLTERIATRNSTYSDVSTPPIDSASDLVSPKSEARSKANKSNETDISYSPDFTEVSGPSLEKMTPWEKWFVMKQNERKRREEIEKNRKLIEEQKLKQQQQKKAEENERVRKLWLERKKLEESVRKESGKEMTEDDTKVKKSSEYGFEEWRLKKLQEKKSQLQYSRELQKYEELQKEIRRKKNEKAQMEWMAKAKQRPITPRVTYGYVGDSVIGFYDSTCHPPPTYINPIPWQP